MDNSAAQSGTDNILQETDLEALIQSITKIGYTDAPLTGNSTVANKHEIRSSALSSVDKSEGIAYNDTGYYFSDSDDDSEGIVVKQSTGTFANMIAQNNSHIWEDSESEDHSITNINIAVEEIADNVKSIIDTEIDNGDRLTDIEINVKNLQHAVKELDSKMSAIGMAVAEIQQFNRGLVNTLSYCNYAMYTRFGPVKVKNGGFWYNITPNGSELIGPVSKSDGAAETGKDN